MKFNLLINKMIISNKKIIHIMKFGIVFSFLLCLIAAFILEIYCSNAIPIVFYIGTSLLKSGMFFISMFIICGIIFNKTIEN